MFLWLTYIHPLKHAAIALSRMGPLHCTVAGIWLELDGVRGFGRKRRRRGGVGVPPLLGDWKRKGEPALANCMLKYSLFTIIIISMSSIWPSIPFCFSLKFCHNNTAVTTPKTVTMVTHSATKEALVEMRTPEEGVAVSIDQCVPCTYIASNGIYHQFTCVYSIILCEGMLYVWGCSSSKLVACTL